jgi:hypothetical protein
MAFAPIPRLLHTVILGIEFTRDEPQTGPLRGGPWYRIDLVVNGDPYSYEVQIIAMRAFSFRRSPDIFAPLKYPVSVLGNYVRRFAEGEIFDFPVDLGDIGKV